MIRYLRLSTALIAATAILYTASPAAAQEAVGRVSTLMGSVLIKRKDGSQVSPKIRDEVFPKDVISTGADGRVKVYFNDDSVLSLGANAELTIKQLVYDPAKDERKGLFSLARGSMMALVGRVFGSRSSSYEIETPTAVAGVRGTYFGVEVLDAETAADLGIISGVTVAGPASAVAGGVLAKTPGATNVFVASGNVSVSGLNPDGSAMTTGQQMLGPRQQSSVGRGQTPSAPVTLSQSQLQGKISSNSVARQNRSGTAKEAYKLQNFNIQQVRDAATLARTLGGLPPTPVGGGTAGTAGLADTIDDRQSAPENKGGKAPPVLQESQDLLKHSSEFRSGGGPGPGGGPSGGPGDRDVDVGLDFPNRPSKARVNVNVGFSK